MAQNPRQPPRRPERSTFDAITLVAFFFAFYLLVIAIFIFGVAESEHRIACALPDVVRTVLPSPDRCP